MRVLFIKTVKGIGKEGEVKEVSEGYAKNFLFPRGIAVLGTDNEIKKLQIKSDIEVNRKQKEERDASLVASQLEGKIFEFKGKTNGKELFGSITSKDIEKELIKRGIRNVEVLLPIHLKTLGEHAVVIKIAGKIKKEIIIRIVGEK